METFDAGPVCLTGVPSGGMLAVAAAAEEAVERAAEEEDGCEKWTLRLTLLDTHCRLPCLVLSSWPESLRGGSETAVVGLASLLSDASHTLFLDLLFFVIFFAK